MEPRSLVVGKWSLLLVEDEDAYSSSSTADK